MNFLGTTFHRASFVTCLKYMHVRTARRCRQPAEVRAFFAVENRLPIRLSSRGTASYLNDVQYLHVSMCVYLYVNMYIFVRVYEPKHIHMYV